MLLKKLFFLILIKPLVFIIIGLHIRHLSRLPDKGPAIIVANHNSHLDTLVLMSLFSLTNLPKVRPVAAAEYFLNKGLLTWIATTLIDIIPLERSRKKSVEKRLYAINQALDNNEIVIIFPEGSRGQPEQLAHFKKGVAHLAMKHPHIPIIPVFLHGLGKCLPKNEGIFVPFICDVIIGKALYGQPDTKEFTKILEQSVIEMGKNITVSPWL